MEMQILLPLQMGLLLAVAGPWAIAETSKPTLREQLAERAAQGGLSDEIREQMNRHLEEVTASGIYQAARKVGDKAPEFTLSDPTGAKFSLSSFLAKGPVVLTWYRGGW